MCSRARAQNLLHNQTLHGLVYQGICLRCNPSPNLANIKLSYGLGWERTIRATDFKFRWERSKSESGSLKSSSSLDEISYYVRKVEFTGGDMNNEGVFCAGRVTFIPYDSSAMDSVVECVKTGRTIVSFSDLERAQKMSLHQKIKWVPRCMCKILQCN